MVALIFVTEYRALQFAVPGMARLIRPLFIASIIWGAHAAREWLVQIQTPEVNIRADLLLIWLVGGCLGMGAIPCVSIGIGAHPRFSGGSRLAGR